MLRKSSRFQCILRWFVLGIFLTTLVMPGVAWAQPAPPEAQKLSARSLSALLNQDGSLDLTSGYIGSLDPSGWAFTTDETGAPRFEGAETSDPGSWDTRFGLPAANGDVMALAIAEDANGVNNLFVGGRFDKIGGVEVKNIARWDGQRWYALQEGIQGDFFGEVHALAVRGTLLYVGGSFTQAGSLNATNLAIWDCINLTWSTWGNGAEGPHNESSPADVNAIAVLGSYIYIGGERISSVDGVSAMGIARWNTTTLAWSEVSGGVFTEDYWVEPARVNTLTAGEDGRLYVGGEFKSASTSDLIVNSIAVWDPTASTWAALGAGVTLDNNPGEVHTILVNGADVYVGGQFDHAGSTATRSIAKWNNITNDWSTLAGGTNLAFGYPANVHALALVDSTLYAAGDFTTIGGVSATGIAKWNPTTAAWSKLSEDFNSSNEQYFHKVLCLLPSGSALYVGGSFAGPGGNVMHNLAQWTGSEWKSVGQLGITDGGSSQWNGVIYAAAVNAKGQLYVAGKFDHVGGTPASNIAMWDGSRWWPLGAGTKAAVYALAVQDHLLYVGGDFTQAGNLSANHVAVWNSDTNTWSGLSSGINGKVYALTVNPDGILYAGGQFTAAGSVDASNVAVWLPDTRTWEKVGTTITGIGRLLYNNGVVIGCGIDSRATVYALDADDTAVFIGGDLNCVKTPTGYAAINSVFFWNRVTDQVYPLDEGVTDKYNSAGTVRALALSEDGSALYVGGTFVKAGTSAASGLARFTSDGWTALDNGVGGPSDPTVLTIKLYGPDVYIGGKFTSAGTTNANYVAHWNSKTNAWSSLGDGIDPYGYVTSCSLYADCGVWAMAAWGNSLLVGGQFLKAGNYPSISVAIWNAAQQTGDVTPGAGGTLTSINDGIHLQFPAGAVTQPVTVRYTREFEPLSPLPAGWLNVHSFTLLAVDQNGNPVTAFINPYTLQVSYSPEQLAVLGIDEDSLTVLYWNGSAWVDFMPCTGCGVDKTNHNVTIVANHFTEFALAGRQATASIYTIYLPLLQR